MTTSPLAAGRAVHRRVPLPSDPNDMEVRALRGQQKIDHDVIDQLNENLVKITFMMSEQCKVVEMQRKRNEENSRRVLAMEGAIKEAVGEANKYTEDKLNSRIGLLVDELKAKLEEAVPKVLGEVEEKLNNRIGLIEKFAEEQKGLLDSRGMFFESLQKATPGEEQTLFNMLKFFDSEMLKLSNCPKADRAFGQSILDEVKEMIKDYVSELKHDCSFQIPGVAEQIHVDLDGRINVF